MHGGKGRGLYESYVCIKPRYFKSPTLQHVQIIYCAIWSYARKHIISWCLSPFLFNGDINNFHLLDLLIEGYHTGQQIFEMTQKVLYVIHPRWKNALIGVASDGARNMTGWHSGLLTYLHQATLPNFIPIWCGAHQLDLVIERMYNKLLKEDFFSVMDVLIRYLRR